MLRSPDRFVGEIARILRPGGRAIIHTTNLLHWESLVAWVTPHRFHELCCKSLDCRESDDVFPVFYEANRVGKLLQIFGAVGMKLEKEHCLSMCRKGFPSRSCRERCCYWNILEVKLQYFPYSAKFRHNLLVVFRKP